MNNEIGINSGCLSNFWKIIIGIIFIIPLVTLKGCILFIHSPETVIPLSKLLEIEIPLTDTGIMSHYIKEIFKDGKKTVTNILEDSISPDVKDLLKKTINLIDRSENNILNVSKTIGMSKEKELFNTFVSNFTSEIQNPLLFAILPSNDIEFKNIYGVLPSLVQRSNIKKALHGLSKLPKSDLIPGTPQEITSQLIKKHESNFIIILGHSKDDFGELIKTTTGEIIKSSDIHNSCFVNKKICLIITCNGEDFNIKGEISITRGLKAWKYAYNKLQKTKNINPQTFIKNIQRKLYDDLDPREIKQVVSSSIIVINMGGTAYAVQQVSTNSEAER